MSCVDTFRCDEAKSIAKLHTHLQLEVAKEDNHDQKCFASAAITGAFGYIFFQQRCERQHAFVHWYIAATCLAWHCATKSRSLRQEQRLEGLTSLLVIMPFCRQGSVSENAQLPLEQRLCLPL